MCHIDTYSSGLFHCPVVFCVLCECCPPWLTLGFSIFDDVTKEAMSTPMSKLGKIRRKNQQARKQKTDLALQLELGVSTAWSPGQLSCPCGTGNGSMQREQMPPGSLLSALSLQLPFLGYRVPPEVEKAWHPSRHSDAGSRDRPLGARPAGLSPDSGSCFDFVPGVGTSKILAAGAVK